MISTFVKVYCKQDTANGQLQLGSILVLPTAGPQGSPGPVRACPHVHQHSPQSNIHSIGTA